MKFDGAVWRFSNKGNRGASAGHPDVYAPRFADDDPVAIGRGRSVTGPSAALGRGRPAGSISSIVSRRKAVFLADRIIDTVGRKWPYIVRSLGQ